MRPSIAKVITVSVTLLTLSCSTISELKRSKDTDSVSAAAGNIVLAKAGGKSPVLSAVDSKTWIEMSESKEPGRQKLQGLLATGNWKEAAEEARRELEKQPGEPNAMVALAAAYAMGRNYEMAGYYAGIVLKSNPSDADALNLLGLRNMMGAGNRRTDYDDAINVFRKAAESNGTHVAALLNMGYLQLDLGDAQAATESFKMAEGRCGQCFESSYGFGLASMRSGAWPQAKSAFEGVLAKDKSKAAAQYQLAIVMNRGFSDPAKAIGLLQNLVSDPDGRYKDAGTIKRAANITLRRWRASDRSAPVPQETTQPHGGELPARAE